jgi:hypothetical protein
VNIGGISDTCQVGAGVGPAVGDRVGSGAGVRGGVAEAAMTGDETAGALVGLAGAEDTHDATSEARASVTNQTTAEMRDHPHGARTASTAASTISH